MIWHILIIALANTAIVMGIVYFLEKKKQAKRNREYDLRHRVVEQDEIVEDFEWKW